MKTCAKCKIDKRLDEFHNNKKRKASWCAKCSNAAKTANISKKQRFVRQQKDVPCYSCGVKYHWVVMDFHHRDPSKKDTRVAEMRSAPMDRIIAEIAKCDILCANCHRMRHLLPSWEVDE